MNVQVIHHKHPRTVAVGGHRLLDVPDEVLLGPCRTERRSDQLPGRHLEVADQAQSPVPSVLELDQLALPRDHRLAGSRSLQRLQAGHLVHADGVGPLDPLPLGRRQVRLTDRLDLLLKPRGVRLGGVEPVATLVGLQGGLAQVAAHLRRRDRRHDAAPDHLIGQFQGRPVGDRPAGLLGGLAGDGQDLGDLLGSELGGSTGAWFVAEDRFDGASQAGAGLTALDVNESVPRLGPAPSPASDLAVCQADLLGDVFIEKAVESHQDDRGALPKPRGRGGGTGEGPKDVLLTLGDGDLGRLARHGEGTPGDWQNSPSR